MLVRAGVQKGNAVRGILQDLLSDGYQSGLAEKGGIPLPQDVVRPFTQPMTLCEGKAYSLCEGCEYACVCLSGPGYRSSNIR